ncbi:MAG TPA: acyl-CoA dehydrogenase family protein [Burkholderiales bacterium]|nr:acyl-CoA dehydrogenase family protein [Burkholderiales bacterium]
MDLSFTPEENAFREEVRGFVAQELPGDVKRKVLEHRRLQKDDIYRWHKALYERGWVAPNWPVEYGGTGWNAIQRHIFDEEAAAGGAPRLSPFGLNMIGPVLIEFGAEQQKRRYLPSILSGEQWWCQGYSEPGSGSDLASLKTRAERRGDVYLVNGQKTWNTHGQWADMIFCLVRTSSTGRKQEGISMLLVDMRSPGVEVRPIITLDGEHEVNEVWLQDVEVPAENLVGEEGRGWTIAKFLLSHERTGIAGVGASKRELKYLKYLASQERIDGRPLIEDPVFRDRVAQLEIDLMALEMTVLRVASAEREGKAPGPEASILKIRGTEIQQTLTELQMEAVGPYALPHLPMAWGDHWIGPTVGPDYAAPLAARYFNHRKVTIYGGTNEIQRNIIAQQVLGL